MSEIVFADPSDPTFKNMVGASVFWTLGGNVNTEALIVELDLLAMSKGKREYENPPANCTMASALLRFMRSEYTKRGTLVRDAKHPMPGNKAPSYGVFTRSETGALKDGYVLQWSVGLTVSDAKHLQSSNVTNALVFDGPCPIERVRTGFMKALQELGHIELSQWLTELVKTRFRALPFGNGMFFIAPNYVSEWRELTATLRQFGITLHEIPAMRSEQAVAAVLSSLESYSDSIREKMDEELDKYANLPEGSRAIQKRVIASRMQQADEQIRLIQGYEQLFDTKLDGLREKFMEAKAAFCKLSMIGNNFSCSD